MESEKVDMKGVMMMFFNKLDLRSDTFKKGRRE